MAYLRETVRLASWLSVPLLSLIMGAFGARAAVGLAAGMLWAMANVWVIGRLIRVSMGTERPQWRSVIGWWALKVPVLYVLGGVLLLSPWSSPVGFLAGFSFWFVALVVSALRRLRTA